MMSGSMPCNRIDTPRTDMPTASGLLENWRRHKARRATRGHMPVLLPVARANARTTRCDLILSENPTLQRKDYHTGAPGWLS